MSVDEVALRSRTNRVNGPAGTPRRSRARRGVTACRSARADAWLRDLPAGNRPGPTGTRSWHPYRSPCRGTSLNPRPLRRRLTRGRRDAPQGGGSLRSGPWALGSELIATSSAWITPRTYRQPPTSATCTCTPGIEQMASGRADSSLPSSRVPESWASPRISQRLGRHTIALSSPITSFEATSGKRQLEKASSWRGRRPRAPDPTRRATWEGDGRSV